MNIRRYYYPGQIVFITQVLKDRLPVFDNPEMVALLFNILKNVNSLHPFSLLAYVILPDHFHILIRPSGQSNFSQIMHSLKSNFTYQYKQRMNITGSVNVWQKRFWDHIIRDETDLENHIHYIHFNPIKHGYVNNINDWQQSSVIEWVKRGLYDKTTNWQEPNNQLWGE